MKKPRFDDYNVKTLVILGNQTNDDIMRNEIKFVLVNKLKDENKSILYLLNNFLKSKDILREVYAELIMIVMYNEELCLSDDFTSEVIRLVSLDTLTDYGMESKSFEFKKKCTNEFWNRVLELEDKDELVKKKYVDSPMSKKLIIGSRKGE